MKKIIEWIYDRILWIFIVITVLGFIILMWFHSKEEPTVIGKIFEALDVASAVALATLAFFGYWKYTNEQREKKRFEKSLKNLNNRDVGENEVALLIQFGGSSDMIEPMKKFIRENMKLNDSKIICAEPFGDSNRNVEEGDILALKKYCEKIKTPCSSYSKVHIFYGGACIGYAVIADILSNSTNILYYHKVGGDYKVWYTDIKSDMREEELAEDSLYR